ncbi:MAG: TonB-dependent receptor plug domain-containing protein, partial [Bacteroidales bacterium]|nr:TonB-dependent receptor plug domain-containing protein [Bacteroidales bacterium]
MNFRFPTKCCIQIVLYCIIIQLFTIPVNAKEKNNCSNIVTVQDSLNLNFHDTELIEILEYIETHSGYLFFYKEKDINLLKKITINAKCKDVFEAMRILSGKSGVKYKIIKKNIVLYNNHKVGNDTKLETMDMLDKNKSGLKQDRIASPFLTITPVKKQELAESSDKNGLKQPSMATEKVKLNIKIVSEKDRVPIENASVVVSPYNLWAISDNKGICIIENVPSGEVEITIHLLGYEVEKRKLILNAGINEQIEVSLKETSLALSEVNVVARSSKAGEATGSYIARQALDHLQATSLKDILQLIPGQLISSNPSLNKIGQFSIRTIDDDNNNAFGSSIVVDGIPVSNNANMNLSGKGGSYSVAGKGVDLRSLGTDNIESIEVIRGIASAEYGDMSSGTLIINSKIGTTPLEIRGKIMPGISQIYAGKGFHTDNFGNINISADYAGGNSDPRYSTDTYKRVNSSIIHTKNLFDGIWNITTKVGLNYIKDWSGSDPDDPIQGQYSQSKDLSLTFSHSGRISLNTLFARTLKYDIGYTNQTSDSYTIKSVNLASGPQPLYSAKNNSTQETFLLPSQYIASGGTKGKPIIFYAKVSDNFFLGYDKFKNNIKIGLEFRNEGNKGDGYYFDNPERPLTITNNRTRSFKDIPFLTQVSGFIEDNIVLKLGKTDLKMQAGLRYTTIQPGKNESKNVLTPRINFVYSPFRILDLR